MALHPLAGIDAKLDRADEHIHEFALAEERFLCEELDRSLVYDDAKTAEAFRDRHEIRAVPLPLSIVAGEAVQQLRSTLDHLVTALVIQNKATATNNTQFPICSYRPVKPDELRRYQAQINGTSASAQALIESHQPYHAGNRRYTQPLAILKNLSNGDKHRALILNLVAIRANVRLSGRTQDGSVHTEALEPAPEAGTHGYTVGAVEGEVEIVNVQRSLTAYVAFPTLGPKKDVPVFGGLWSLSRSTRKVIDSFRPEIP